MCRKNKETITTLITDDNVNANLRDYSALFGKEVDPLPLSMHFPDIGKEYADAIKYIKDKDFEDVLEYHGVNPIELVRRIEQLQLEIQTQNLFQTDILHILYVLIHIPYSIYYSARYSFLGIVSCLHLYTRTKVYTRQLSLRYN